MKVNLCVLMYAFMFYACASTLHSLAYIHDVIVFQGFTGACSNYGTDCVPDVHSRLRGAGGNPQHKGQYNDVALPATRSE